jgi:hypothetical protein
MSNDKTNGSGPAFPTDAGDFGYQVEWKGMSLRQYAAIKLRVPDSGEEWLDKMILQSLRDEFAGRVIPEVFKQYADQANAKNTWDAGWQHYLSKDAYALADALLKAREQ